MLQNLARDFERAGHDSHLVHATGRGIADVDHELSELLRKGDTPVDHGAIARHIHHFGEVLRSPEFERTITGLPDHVAKSIASEPGKLRHDLPQLGVITLDALTERVVEMLAAAAGKAGPVGIVRAGYETVKSEHPYKEALRQALAWAPGVTAEVGLEVGLGLLCPPALPVALAVTIAVEFTIGDEIIYKRVSPVVADHIEHWARRNGLVRKYERELEKHKLLCALGRNTRDGARCVDRQFGRFEQQVTHAAQRIL